MGGVSAEGTISRGGGPAGGTISGGGLWGHHQQGGSCSLAAEGGGRNAGRQLGSWSQVGSRQPKPTEPFLFGKAFIQIPPLSQKGGGGFQQRPRCETGCPHPCLLPPVPVLSDRQPVQGSRSEAAKDNFPLLVSHPSGHLLHGWQGGQEAPRLPTAL